MSGATRGARLRLIAGIFAVVLGGFAVGSAIDAYRLPGVNLAPSATLAAVLGDTASPTIGSPGAGVNVIVFTDYRCGICRSDHPGIMAAVAKEPGTRLTIKEWAVLGPVSREAARIALAARYQGRYAPVHDRLMRQPLAPAAMVQVVDGAGADWPRLQRDFATHAAEIERELARVSRQAFSLGLPGTPVYLVGRRMVIGRLREDQLRRLIARARASDE